jgi:hypothetical protein
MPVHLVGLVRAHAHGLEERADGGSSTGSVENSVFVSHTTEPEGRGGWYGDEAEGRGWDRG